MRPLLLLFAVVVAGCEPSSISATWDEAEVSSSDRAISIHPLWPLAHVRAEVVNRTDSAATFFLGGRGDGYGFLIGGEPTDPGRFLLVGPDTTLPMVARVWDRVGAFGDPAPRTVAPGDTLRLALWTDNQWQFPPPGQPRSPLVPVDSAAAARFYGRALRQGRIIYVSGRHDTLVVARAPGAEVHFRAEDQPSALY